MNFAKKNPFADFSSFEENIEKMQPLTPDPEIQQMTNNIQNSITQSPIPKQVNN